MALYEDFGKPLTGAIDIVAQDPSYTENDKHLLSLLPRPIRVVTDPEGYTKMSDGNEMFNNRSVYQDVVTVVDAAVTRKAHECFEWLGGMEL